MARTVHILPHTHWDREWYKPFQTFRMTLVDLVDELLPLLEADPSYAHFMLDGQMAVIDDYLEIRPHEADRLRRLALSGRLSVGPWYILMDEFLVSGETMVRDLALGLEKAAEFGGAMTVGYLPDMFGHIAQMPQLLRQFGFDHTTVWRGVPDHLCDSPAFWWEAPDGSRVRAEYLPRGYGNGAKLPDDAKDLIEQVDRYAEAHPDQATDPLLWMNGTDHLHPQPKLGRLVAEANSLQDRWHFRVGGLAEFAADAVVDGLPTYRGELRSGARANLLMGVASNRVDVKQAAARAERALEREAEPLWALFAPATAWPSTFLATAWREVIRNSAHDSICACSVDEVVDAVLHRFDEAIEIAEGLTERALGAVAEAAGGDRPIAVNPVARTRGGIVSFRLPLGADVPGTQPLWSAPAEVPFVTMTAADAVGFHRVIVENLLDVDRIDVETRDDGSLDVHIHSDERRFGLLDPAPSLDAIKAAAAAQPGAECRLHWAMPPSRVVLAHVADVPGFGWRRTGPGPLTVAPVTTSERTLSNGILTVEVAEDGTYAINGQAGLGRLVDDGDVGDTYNWCPPADDTVIDAPMSVSVRVVESGPVRGRLAITAQYAWPERAAGQRRVGSRPVTVTTTLELHAGDDLLRVDIALDNQSRDHRVRAWFPLPSPAATSVAECAFATVERGLTAEGGANEEGVPTFPSRRFVCAGGLTVAHEGLLEYELVDIAGSGDMARAGALAITLLRCTGLLSQIPMRTRMLPAGPITPMEGPQMQGPQRFRYAVHLGGRDPYDVVDDAFVPLLALGVPGGPELVSGESHQALSVSGAVVSAVLRDPSGGLTVRVFNPSASPTTVTIDGRHGWKTDLRGRPIEAFERSFDLAPWAIQTVQLLD
jgi:mannosylglycerate hydrolase